MEDYPHLPMAQVTKNRDGIDVALPSITLDPVTTVPVLGSFRNDWIEGRGFSWRTARCGCVFGCTEPGELYFNRFDGRNQAHQRAGAPSIAAANFCLMKKSCGKISE
jgi:hypothetical protein